MSAKVAHNNEVVGMKLVPWRPFGELRTLRREMEHSSSRSFDDTPFPRLVLGEWVPWVDISIVHSVSLLACKVIKSKRPSRMAS